MDFLQQWVRGLVMLTILATCLELLIPMNDMKKYVRMSMGLLIVLAMVSPVASLIGHRLTFNPDLLLGRGERDLPSLDQVMARAQAFRTKNRDMERKEAIAGLAAEARRAAQAVDGVAEARAEVHLADDPGEAQIGDVLLRLRLGVRQGGVRPVAPVRVGPNAPAPAARTDEAEQTLISAVRSAVATRLDIRPDPERIRIVIEDRLQEKGR